jgi:hypothetical protein
MNGSGLWLSLNGLSDINMAINIFNDISIPAERTCGIDPRDRKMRLSLFFFL